MNNKTSYISLKWGTLKSWHFISEEEKKLFKEYSDIGMSCSAAMQKDTPEQKKIVCQLIDKCTNPDGIYLDWDAIYVTREEAKKYVMNYGLKTEAQK